MPSQQCRVGNHNYLSVTWTKTIQRKVYFLKVMQGVLSMNVEKSYVALYDFTKVNDVIHIRYKHSNLNW